MQARREFLGGLAAAAGAAGLAPMFEAAVAAQGAGTSSPAAGDPATKAFWSGFLDHSTTPPRRVPTERPRGVTTSDREPFFFFFEPGRGLYPAVDMPTSAMIADGDVSINVNFSTFKFSNEDHERFQRLQNFHLRVDVLQTVALIDLLDTMAWTALAGLWQEKQAKLPPLQTISFDPATVWKKMQNVLLPKGTGRWALNLYAQRPDSFWSRLLQTATKEVGRFAPVLGLPGFAMTGLQSFNEIYAAYRNPPEHVFHSNPVPVLATASAVKVATLSNAIPLRSGSYVLVPVGQAHELTEARLKDLELRQGFLVPKNTPSQAVRRAADEALPNVTYATMDLSVKAVPPPACKS
jgi:hypothetical protein